MSKLTCFFCKSGKHVDFFHTFNERSVHVCEQCYYSNELPTEGLEVRLTDGIEVGPPIYVSPKDIGEASKERKAQEAGLLPAVVKVFSSAYEEDKLPGTLVYSLFDGESGETLYLPSVPVKNDDNGRINGLFEMYIQAETAGHKVSEVKVVGESAN